MILIAGTNQDKTAQWRDWLGASFTVYEKQPTEKRQLDICIKKLELDLIILHLPILGKEGINDVAQIHDLQPKANIVIFTDEFDKRDEISAVLFGAKAYLKDDIQRDLFNKVISHVLDGEIWVDRKFVSRLLAEIEDITAERHEEAVEIEKGIASMTPRESEIAELIAEGASNRRIAEKLYISERTVKAHLGVIFKKIGIKDRLQLALYMNKYHQLSSLWHPRKPSQ